MTPPGSGAGASVMSCRILVAVFECLDERNEGRSKRAHGDQGDCGDD